MNHRPLLSKSRILVSMVFMLHLPLIISAQNSSSGPNILVIFSDDLNTNIGPYMEIENHTPNLDRLAREGVRFTSAYCQYPLCCPSRAPLMCGLSPESNEECTNNDQPVCHNKIHRRLPLLP